MKKLAKSIKSTGKLRFEADAPEPTTSASAFQHEEELMGATGNGKKSEVMGKNLDQMVFALHGRLKALEVAAKSRRQLCGEDLNANSTNTSGQATKLLDEFDEVIPKSLKEIKQSTLAVRENLVSSDTVYIDPSRLVLRTKPATETAKKIELALEESFGNVNYREMKNKKSKSMNHAEKSKKSEQLKNEAKRLNRLKIEKKLQVNMENFVTRTVIDPEIRFVPPELDEDGIDGRSWETAEIEWPIPVKWPARDPRSQHPNNSEGEFDPDLLLAYAIERINLPSGKHLFAWLTRQQVIQNYFLYLFWIIKLRFFEHDSPAENELVLLKLLSAEYRKIIRMLAERAHAEHEKDFVFKYFPFILANGVYFGFFYLCPGSRHLYTKGVRKTIYMQVVQIMFGLQISTMSVKVSWAKLFPEDVQDEGEGGGGGSGDGENEGAETFPVLIALHGNKPRQTTTTIESKSRKRENAFIQVSTHDTVDNASGQHGPSKSGQIAGGEDAEDASVLDHASVSSWQSGAGNKPGSAPDPTLPRLATFSGKPTMERSRDDESDTLSTTSASSSMKRGGDASGLRTNAKDFMLLEFMADTLAREPISRTHLKPLPDRPGSKFYVKRQNNIESFNAHQMSPQIQTYLDTKSSSKIATLVQPLARTMPISWCAAGGSDTHKKKVINTDKHNTISMKMRQNEAQSRQSTLKFLHAQIRDMNELDKQMKKVLSSGQTNVSKFNLDLMRRHRSLKNGDGSSGAGPVAPAEELTMEEVIKLANYDDSELEKFLSEI